MHSEMRAEHERLDEMRAWVERRPEMRMRSQPRAVQITQQIQQIQQEMQQMWEMQQMLQQEARDSNERISGCSLTSYSFTNKWKKSDNTIGFLT